MSDDKIEIKGIATIKEVDPDTGEVLSEETKENLIVHDAGSEQIADYIAGNTPANHFEYMAIGSDGTSATKDDTGLGTQTAISTAITPSVISGGTYDRVVQWVHTFSAGDGGSSVEEMGMFNGSTGTGTDGMLNHLTFTAKDNQNNDLEITYELTIN